MYGYISVQDKETQTSEEVQSQADCPDLRCIVPSGKFVPGTGKYKAGQAMQTKQEKNRKIRKVMKRAAERKKVVVPAAVSIPELDVDLTLPWVLRKIDIPAKTPKEKREYKNKIELLRLFGSLDLPEPLRDPKPSTSKPRVELAPFIPPCKTPEYITNFDVTDPLGLKSLD